VAVRARTAEKGQIVIDYHSLDEFDRLARFFQIEPLPNPFLQPLAAPSPEV
jgi:hypothetical protein